MYSALLLHKGVASCKRQTLTLRREISDTGFYAPHKLINAELDFPYIMKRLNVYSYWRVTHLPELTLYFCSADLWLVFVSLYSEMLNGVEGLFHTGITRSGGHAGISQDYCGAGIFSEEQRLKASKCGKKLAA